MNKVILLFFSLLCGILTAGSSINFEGGHYWSIRNNACNFTGGNIVNNDPAGNRSGTLRICLVASPSVFPSKGYRVATATIGTLKGGYGYFDYKFTASASVPNITGFYYFTIVVEEFTQSGWVTAEYISNNASMYLKKGIFSRAPVWKAPAGAIIKPMANFKSGNTIFLVHQGGKSGDGSIGYIPPGSQLSMKMQASSGGRAVFVGGTKTKTDVLYSYKVGKSDYKGKSCQVGRLFVDFGTPVGTTSYGDHTLYFQSKNKGFYRSKDVTTNIGLNGESWGIFGIK
ncbi:MAG: hypothetical protein EOP84_04060 [Verrucomicrobiaceae bacterium]|nr:MAG: hypothetical protein EOP84_04060 [Verrucomicrobiaceae bacterium]